MSVTERIQNGYTLFTEEKDIGEHLCNWRVVECSGEKWDIAECSRCGKQRRVLCTFDEDYS